MNKDGYSALRAVANQASMNDYNEENETVKDTNKHVSAHGKNEDLQTNKLITCLLREVVDPIMCRKPLEKDLIIVTYLDISNLKGLMHLTTISHCSVSLIRRSKMIAYFEQFKNKEDVNLGPKDDSSFLPTSENESSHISNNALNQSKSMMRRLSLRDCRQTATSKSASKASLLPEILHHLAPTTETRS